MRSLLLVFTLASLLTACGGSKEEPATEEPTTTQAESELKTWMLTSYGPTASPQTVAEGIEVTLQMDLGEGRISGKSACNRYTGSINDDSAPYRFGPIAGTRMMCAEEAVNQMEMTYLQLMEKVTAMKIENGVLTLDVEGGQMLSYASK